MLLAHVPDRQTRHSRVGGLALLADSIPLTCWCRLRAARPTADANRADPLDPEPAATRPPDAPGKPCPPGMALVDGHPVRTADDVSVSRVATGALVHLTVRVASGQSADVEIVAHQGQAVPPVRDAPPFWTVGAAEFDQAPQWARRNLFGHVSPMCMLVNADGGTTDSRQLDHGSAAPLVADRTSSTQTFARWPTHPERSKPRARRWSAGRLAGCRRSPRRCRVRPRMRGREISRSGLILV